MCYLVARVRERGNEKKKKKKEKKKGWKTTLKCKHRRFTRYISLRVYYNRSRLRHTVIDGKQSGVCNYRPVSITTNTTVTGLGNFEIYTESVFERNIIRH